MPRPIVEIYQSVANVTLTPSNPTLPLCLVGPAYKLLQYPANRALKHVYGARGGWDDPFEVEGADAITPRDAVEDVPYTTFGFDVGAHTVEAESVKVYLEDIYYGVKVATDKAEIAGGTVAAGRTISTVDKNISQSVPAGGVKAGDRVIIAPQMPQVLYDANEASAFLTSVAVNDYVLFKSDGGVGEDDPDAARKQYKVLQVIDDHRLLLEDSPGASLNALAGVVDDPEVAAFTYAVYSAIISADESVTDGEIAAAAGNLKFTASLRGRRILHTPVECIVKAVTGVFGFTLAKDVKFASGEHANSKLNMRFERLLPPSANGTAPGYLLDGDTQVPDADSVVLGEAGGDAHYMLLGVSGVDVPVTRANVFLAARGLIINKPDFMTFSSIPSTLDFPNIGKVHPDNPLGLAMYVALSNAGGNTVQALAIASDDAAGYAAALPKLNSHGTVYCIVPLSTDIANVIAPYKNAAVAMSAPAKGKFRHVIGASAGLPAYKFVGATLGDETGTGEYAAGVAFHDDDAAFTTDGVVANDLLFVTSMGGVDYDPPLQYKVATVVNEQNLTLTAAVSINDTGAVAAAVAGDWVYTIQRSISSDSTAQVAALLARIANVGSHRLTMIYPGECKVLGHSSLPGYYIAAGVGAMVSAFSPHRPKNQIGLAAIEQIYDSNLHFSYDEIDAISDGGYFVMLQDSVDGLAYCVHQLTTGQIGSPGVQEYCELSVVNNFDYVSLVIKRRLAPFVGVWNMVPEAFGAIRSTLEATISDLRTRNEAQIGAPVLRGNVDAIEVSAADSGTLEISVGVFLPKVLNRLQVFLESQ